MLVNETEVVVADSPELETAFLGWFSSYKEFRNYREKEVLQLISTGKNIKDKDDKSAGLEKIHLELFEIFLQMFQTKLPTIKNTLNQDFNRTMDIDVLSLSRELVEKIVDMAVKFKIGCYLEAGSLNLCNPGRVDHQYPKLHMIPS